ncbi:MAG TPA: hypothetical protein DEH11_04100 [Actinobacteria bacterium]|nr:hypothetical protein [Actinomycetota bacterium]
MAPAPAPPLAPPFPPVPPVAPPAPPVAPVAPLAPPVDVAVQPSTRTKPTLDDPLLAQMAAAEI